MKRPRGLWRGKADPVLKRYVLFMHRPCEWHVYAIQITLFDEIYDGRNGYNPAQPGGKIDQDSIKPGDVILVQCHMGRYRHYQNGGKKSSKWVAWRSQYILRRIVLLCSVPQNVHADAQADINFV